MFLSIDSAIDYLRSKLQDFYNQSRVLRDRLITIGLLLQKARDKGDQVSIGKLIVLQSQTKDLFNDQLALEQKLMPFAQYFGIKTDLAAVPLALAGLAIAAATALYLHYQKLQNQKQALDLVAKGLLSPTEAKQIIEAGSILGAGGLTGLTQNIGLIMVLAIGGLFIWQWSRR
jgi:hypothetical protein